MTRSLCIALVCLVVACGAPSSDDAESDAFFLAHEGDGTFEIDADADTYTGPAPLTVRFGAQALNASGDVGWDWSFDDRATSTEQHPTHTFRKPGWYAVTVDGRDTAGGTYRSNLILHVWRPKDWARMQRGQDLRIVRRSIRELQRKNAEVAAAAAKQASNEADRDPRALAAR